MADENSKEHRAATEKLGRLRYLLNRLKVYDKANENDASDNTISGKEFVAGMVGEYGPIRPLEVESWKERAAAGAIDTLRMGFAEAAEGMRSDLRKALEEIKSDERKASVAKPVVPTKEARAEAREREQFARQIESQLPPEARKSPDIQAFLRLMRTGELTPEMQKQRQEHFANMQRELGEKHPNLAPLLAQPPTVEKSLQQQIQDIQKQLAEYKPQNIKDPTQDDIRSGLNPEQSAGRRQR